MLMEQKTQYCQGDNSSETGLQTQHNVNQNPAGFFGRN